MDRASDRGMVGDRGLEPLTSTVCRKRRKYLKCRKYLRSADKRSFFRAFWISIEFDIVRYVLIFLTSFGHKLGTKARPRFFIDQHLPR